MGKPGDQPDPLQRDRAHGARIYDYLLRGKDNYEMDRAAGDASVKVWPALPIHMHAGRSFMHRVGRYLAREAGIRQFLDIGTGIPTKPNLHEIVQEIAPDARIVYVDNDPIVLAHSRALMHGTREGRIEYIDGDMRDPEAKRLLARNVWPPRSCATRWTSPSPLGCCSFRCCTSSRTTTKRSGWSGA